MAYAPCGAKGLKKKKVGAEVAPVKAKKVKQPEPESESSSEESSDEATTPVKAVVKAKNAKAVPQKQPEPESSSEEDSDEDESEPKNGKAAGNGKAAAKAAGNGDKADSNDDSNEEDSEDEKPAFPTPKANAKGAAPAKAQQKKPAADESSEEDSDDDDDGEEEKPQAKKAAAQKSAKAQPAKKAAADDDDDDESSDDDDDNDDSEDDSDEESDDSEEEAPAPKVVKGKQPVPAKKPAKVPAKLTVVVSNVKGVEDAQLKKFFKKKGIKVKEIRRTDKKTVAVDLLEAGDVAKAVALSGQEVGGKALKIDSASSAAAPKKQEKQAKKRPVPADDDDEEEEEDDDDDDDEEEESAAAGGKRKKSDDAGAAMKKPKLDESATEAVPTLFVGNLNADTTEDAVKKFFKKGGVKVKEVRKIEKKRFGYVDLKSEDDVEAALALSGQELEGNEIKVEQAKPKDKSFEKSPPQQRGMQQNRPQRDASDDTRTLFVKGLADSVTESTLQEFFSKAEQVRLPQKDGYHKGFAYIVFPDAETAESVLSEKQGADLEGNALYLDHTGSKSSFKPRERDSFGGRGGGRGGFGGDRAKSTGERGSTNVLFVKNLSFHLDEEGLKDSFPNATSARIAKFPDTQKPKGFGFVEFGSPDEAAKAYDEMQNSEIDGRQVEAEEVVVAAEEDSAAAEEASVAGEDTVTEEVVGASVAEEVDVEVLATAAEVAGEALVPTHLLAETAMERIPMIVTLLAALLSTSCVNAEDIRTVEGLPMTFYAQDGDVVIELRELTSLQKTQAFVFAVEQINKNPAILPNLTLGFAIADDCSKDTTAMARALHFVQTRLNWTYVSIVYSAGSYGSQGLRAVTRAMEDTGACLASVIEVHQDFKKEHFTWVGSDALAGSLQDFKDFEQLVQGTITVNIHTKTSISFNRYFQSLTSRNCTNPWFRDFLEASYNCSFTSSGKNSNTCPEDLSFDQSSYKPEFTTSLIIDAVNVYAHALDSLLSGCNSSSESDLRDCFRGEELFPAILRTSFDGESGPIRFDSGGDGETTYTIQTLARLQDGTYDLLEVGRWDMRSQILQAWNPDDITWREELLVDVDGNPVKIPRCERCPSNTSFTWPDPDTRTRCDPIPPSNAGLLHSTGPAVPCADVVLLGVAVTVLSVYARNDRHHLIRASGRPLCYVAMAGVICSCFGVMFFAPNVTWVSCTASHVMFHLAFTVSYAPMVTAEDEVKKVMAVKDVEGRMVMAEEQTEEDEGERAETGWRDTRVQL
nr:hypothetical protein BaRGS_006697 [Batillaria attramentaria]